jgi:2-dehydropantoate 2-reductase
LFSAFSTAAPGLLTRGLRARQRVAIFGAGSVGAFVGGMLIAAGVDVVLVGRQRMQQRIARHGLLLSDLNGTNLRLAPESIPFFTDPSVLKDVGLILVTVKSADTRTAGELIGLHAKSSTIVVSLQNGIGNAETLRAVLPGWKVLAGMVPFNVVQTEDGRVHRGTEGAMMVEPDPDLSNWLPLFRSAGLPFTVIGEFESVLWGKLLLNLNNAVNALSGVPLTTELSQRSYRRSLAMLMAETLRVLREAGINPAKLGKLPPWLVPHVLRLPDWLFRRIAGAMLRIDPQARSSMWEDLQSGRKTEIDYINGAVVRLAESVGRDAPVNRKIIALIRRVEAGGGAEMSGEDLRVALRAALHEGVPPAQVAARLPD